MEAGFSGLLQLYRQGSGGQSLLVILGIELGSQPASRSEIESCMSFQIESGAHGPVRDGHDDRQAHSSGVEAATLPSASGPGGRCGVPSVSQLRSHRHRQRVRRVHFRTVIYSASSVPFATKSASASTMWVLGGDRVWQRPPVGGRAGTALRPHAIPLLSPSTSGFIVIVLLGHSVAQMPHPLQYV